MKWCVCGIERRFLIQCSKYNLFPFVCDFCDVTFVFLGSYWTVKPGMYNCYICHHCSSFLCDEFSKWHPSRHPYRGSEAFVGVIKSSFTFSDRKSYRGKTVFSVNCLIVDFFLCVAHFSTNAFVCYVFYLFFSVGKFMFKWFIADRKN